MQIGQTRQQVNHFQGLNVFSSYLGSDIYILLKFRVGCSYLTLCPYCTLNIKLIFSREEEKHESPREEESRDVADDLVDMQGNMDRVEIDAM